MCLQVYALTLGLWTSSAESKHVTGVCANGSVFPCVVYMYVFIMRGTASRSCIHRDSVLQLSNCCLGIAGTVYEPTTTLAEAHFLLEVRNVCLALLHIHPLNLGGIVQNHTYIQKDVRKQPDRMIGEWRCSGFQMHAQGEKPGVQCDFCHLIKLFLVILYNMTAVKFLVKFRQIVDTNSFVIFRHDWEYWLSILCQQFMSCSDIQLK